MKVAILSSVCLAAIALGAMAAAWRRACVHISRQVYAAPDQDAIIRFTPRLVSIRHILALALLLASAILGWLFYRWWIGLMVAATVYGAMELGALLLPRSTHPYYLNSILRDFGETRELYASAGNEEAANEFAERIAELEEASPTTSPTEHRQKQ